MSDKVVPPEQINRVKAFAQSDNNCKPIEENLELFKKVVESATDAIGISTPEGRHWYQNAAFDALFGDIGEDPPTKLYYDKNVGAEVFATIMAGGEWSGEVQMVAADGRVLDILLRAHAFTDEAGRILGLVGVHTDITASKRSQELFKLVAQSTNDVFYEWNVQTDSLQWFSDISAELGYAHGEVPPTINGWIELIHPDDRLQLADAVTKHRTATDDINYLYRVKHKNGTWRYWHDHARPILDSHGRPVRWVGGISDITERKKAEEALAFKVSLENIISKASRRLLRLTDLDASINACLADIGRLCAAGRAYLFQFTSDGAMMNNTHEWCASGVNPEIANLQGLPLEMFPWWMKLLEAGENIHVKNVAELASEARAEKEILEAQNIKSVLVVPLLIANRLAGFLGFDNVGSTRTWGQKELIPLRTLAEIIGTALTRKRAEQVLRESEEKFARAFQLNPDTVIITRMKDGTILDVNESFTNISGYSREAAIGRSSVADLSLWADPQARDRYFDELGRAGAVRDMEAWFRIKNGDQRLGSMCGVVIEIGGEQCILGTIRDITEERRAAEQLAAEKERLAVTLHSIGDAVITTDSDGRIILMNPIAEDLTGWNAADAVGRPLMEVFQIVDERTRKPCANPVDKVIASGQIVGLANHTLLVAKDGREFYITDSGAPILGLHGDILGVVLVFRDTTERQRMEKELLKMEKLQSLGVLAGGIAHDFNNFLTGIIGNLSLAKLDVKPGHPVGRALGEMEKAALRAKDLTQQLLTFSKGGAPVKQITRIANLVRESAQFALRGSNVRCEFAIDDNLRPAAIDDGQIAQVVHNLMINADQAMPDGGVVAIRGENISLASGNSYALDPGDYVQLSIRDQGMGIKTEYLKKVFDPYFTTKQKGSGLGLAVAYSIVARHDGQLTVDSTLGEGATFTLLLPASQRAQTASSQAPDGLMTGSGRILVMDDEDFIRELASVMLQKMGYEVALAEDGQQALALYRDALEAARPFDAVILDLTVPGGMGGQETMRQLTTVDPHVRAIVSSGYSNDPVMANHTDHGFRAAVKKPYRVQEMSRILREVIQG